MVSKPRTNSQSASIPKWVLLAIVLAIVAVVSLERLVLLENTTGQVFAPSIVSAASTTSSPPVETPTPHSLSSYPYFVYNGAKGLYFVECTSNDCSTKNTTLIDKVGGYAQLELSPDYLPVILYDRKFIQPSGPNSGPPGIYLVRCQNSSCTVSTRKLVYPYYGAGAWATMFSKSLAVPADDKPIFTYGNLGDYTLRVIKCNDSQCNTFVENTFFPNEPGVGGDSKIKIGSDGLPVIAVVDDVTETVPNGPIVVIRVVKCNDAPCSSFSSSYLRQAVTNSTPMTTGVDMEIGSDGLPIIVYGNMGSGKSRVAKCSSLSCDTTSAFYWVAGGQLGMYPNVMIGEDGNPMITLNKMIVQKCGDLSCSPSMSTITNLNSIGNIAVEYGVFREASGLPRIIIQRGASIQNYCTVVQYVCQNDSCSNFSTNIIVDNFVCGLNGELVAAPFNTIATAEGN